MGLTCVMENEVRVIFAQNHRAHKQIYCLPTPTTAPNYTNYGSNNNNINNNNCPNSNNPYPHNITSICNTFHHFYLHSIRNIPLLSSKTQHISLNSFTLTITLAHVTASHHTSIMPQLLLNQ